MAEYVKRQARAAQDRDGESGGNAREQTQRNRPARAGDDQSVTSMMLHQTKAIVGEQVSKRAGKPAADIGKLAKALELTSEQLEGNVASPYVKRAASQLERFAQFLEDAKGEEALRTVEQFARKQPLLFLSGAAVLGFGTARFLKSSGHR